MMLTGGKWGEASCAHCNRSLGAAITCPYCGFINAHVDSDGEALAEQEKQEPVTERKEQVNQLIKESARLIGSIKDKGDQYLTAIDALRNAYRIGLKDSPVDAKAIRAEALEQAAKVADRHSTCLNDTPNVIAAAIRGLK